MASMITHYKNPLRFLVMGRTKMKQSVAVPVLRHDQHAKIPTMGSKHAAGSDLYACLMQNGDVGNLVIPAKGRAVVPTAVSMAIPAGCYGRIAPRSSLAAKHGIDIGAGVIDSDYRGLIGVILFNHGNHDYTVSHGDRIAQIIITPYVDPEFVEVYQALEKSERDQGGFGSTGV